MDKGAISVRPVVDSLNAASVRHHPAHGSLDVIVHGIHDAIRGTLAQVDVLHYVGGQDLVECVHVSWEIFRRVPSHEVFKSKTIALHGASRQDDSILRAFVNLKLLRRVSFEALIGAGAGEVSFSDCDELISDLLSGHAVPVCYCCLDHCRVFVGGKILIY